ncbi:Os11g0546200 [Oryza sativa Japonica Group]|jgi:hypothetical protein|uniref:Os11g0546200 protein n=1 Tax=Oryza sativa subsp. japonica TaxID=39947 RepID=Q0IS88_ORYSJ|nr:Os11g0546200 [Oryza sativa Japonica Group]|eukprot:NP_001068064.2 Os11g0546200 [Oryza sativa Japonica Group]
MFCSFEKIDFLIDSSLFCSFSYTNNSIPMISQVNYALGALYYLCNPSTKKDILKPEVLKAVREYAVAGDANTSFRNLANAFLDKHVNS